MIDQTEIISKACFLIGKLVGLLRQYDPASTEEILKEVRDFMSEISKKSSCVEVKPYVNYR